METYNRVIIIGRLGQKPELKEVQRDGKTTYYTVFEVSNATFQDGYEVVSWHKVSAFGKQARLCCEHLNEGDLCCVEGSLDQRKYENATGKIALTTVIVAERITFLSKRKPATDAESVA